MHTSTTDTGAHVPAACRLQHALEVAASHSLCQASKPLLTCILTCHDHVPSRMGCIYRCAGEAALSHSLSACMHGSAAMRKASQLCWQHAFTASSLNSTETVHRYVDQGGGKRKGAFALYLEPWHADVYDFIDLRKNHGKEEVRAPCCGQLATQAR